MPKSKAKRGKKQLSAKQKGIYRFHGLLDYTDGTERKFYDVSNALISSTLDEPHIATPLLGMPQNNTASGRSGLKIWVTSISAKITFNKPISVAGGTFSKAETNWYYRLLVDRNTNGSLISGADYQSISTGTARPNGGLQVFMPNMPNAQRFTTLKTGRAKTRAYNTDGDQADQNGHHEFFVRFPGKGMEVTINNTDGGITGFKSNNLYLFLQNDDVTGYEHSYHIFTRVRFTD